MTTPSFICNNALIYDEQDSSSSTSNQSYSDTPYVGSEENDPMLKSTSSVVTTQRELTRKDKLISALMLVDLDNHTLADRSSFLSVKKSHKEDLIRLDFYHKNGGTLGLELDSRYSSQFYVGISGSPTKLLSGQNLIDDMTCYGEALIDKIRSRSSCSRFEAISVAGFILVQATFKKVLGEDFFSKVEMKKILGRRITVRAIGFASYEKFGETAEEKTRALNLLAALTSSTIESKEDGRLVNIQLISLFDSTLTSERNGMGNMKSGYDGNNVTVTVKKTKRDGTLICTQSIYDKEIEVEEKKGKRSGRGNYSVDLSPTDRVNLSTHVRVDNVFHAAHLVSWVKAFNLASGQKAPDRVQDKSASSSVIYLDEFAPLFDSKENIRVMVQHMRSELGLRAVLLSPSVKKIERLVYSDSSYLSADDRVALKEWIEDRSLKFVRSRRGFSSTWSSKFITLSDAARKDLLTKDFLDVSAPFVFYMHLDAARANFGLTVSERADWRQGTLNMKIDTDQMRSLNAKMHASITGTILFLRSSVQMDVLPLEKHKTVKEFFLH